MIKFKPNLEELGVLKARVQGLPQAVQPMAMVGAARSADQLARMVREALLTQSVRMKALTKAWKQEKRRLNLDPRKLIATTEYVNSIQAYKVRGGYAVGTDWPYVLLHEYGAPGAGIPARPHWRPTVNKWQKTTGKNIQDSFYTQLAKFFKTGITKADVALTAVAGGKRARNKLVSKVKKTALKALGVTPTKKRRSVKGQPPALPSRATAGTTRRTAARSTLAISIDVEKIIQEALKQRRRKRPK